MLRLFPEYFRGIRLYFFISVILLYSLNWVLFEIHELNTQNYIYIYIFFLLFFSFQFKSIIMEKEKLSKIIFYSIRLSAVCLGHVSVYEFNMSNFSIFKYLLLFIIFSIKFFYLDKKTAQKKAW